MDQPKETNPPEPHLPKLDLDFRLAETQIESLSEAEIPAKPGEHAVDEFEVMTIEMTSVRKAIITDALGFVAVHGLDEEGVKAPDVARALDPDFTTGSQKGYHTTVRALADAEENGFVERQSSGEHAGRRGNKIVPTDKLLQLIESNPKLKLANDFFSFGARHNETNADIIKRLLLDTVNKIEKD